MELQVEDGIIIGMKGVAVRNCGRHNENVTVGNVERGVVDVMLAVTGHYNIQFIEIMGMNGRVQKGLIVKICLHQLTGFKNLVIGEML